MAPPAHLRDCLHEGGVLVVWCGAGLQHEQATVAARRESARLLASLQMDGLHISRSACDGLGAVAACAKQPVGIDVEVLADTFEDAALLHPAERHEVGGAMGGAVAAWVRKEAVLKALGIGLVVAPHEIEVGGDDFDWRRVHVRRYGTALVRTLCAPSPHVRAAVAVQQGLGPVASTSGVALNAGFIDTPCAEVLTMMVGLSVSG